MNKLLIALAFITLLTSCHPTQAPLSSLSGHSVAKRQVIQYSDEQLEQFLDSIGRLSTQPLAIKVTAYADSIFKNPIKADSLITLNDFALLKRAAHKGSINIADARRIFGNVGIDTTCTSTSLFSTVQKGFIAVKYFPFDNNAFDEYAISLGDPDHCENARLCFMKANRIVAVHNGGSRYGLELSHFKDNDHKTIIYYRKEFVSGSGNWWNNLFFYKYDNGKLIPVLNELQNGNMQAGGMGDRVLWMESFVQKTNPLTIKMVYYDQLPDTTRVDDFGPYSINDSTTVEYTWNNNLKILEGQYFKSKISKAQILSYYLGNTDLLFIRSYYPLLKSSLADTAKRRLTLKYLNVVKNKRSFL
jgi:hypothetical protein